jgi:hypothetical protein
VRGEDEDGNGMRRESRSELPQIPPSKKRNSPIGGTATKATRTRANQARRMAGVDRDGVGVEAPVWERERWRGRRILVDAAWPGPLCFCLPFLRRHARRAQCPTSAESGVHGARSDLG